MAANVISVLELSRVFTYDVSSPSCIKLKIDKYRGRKHTTLVHRQGSNVGSISSQGYYVTTHCGVQIACHRIVYSIVNNFQLSSEDFVDHIDGNRENNLVENLRLATGTENKRNSGLYRNNTTGCPGVTLNKSRGGRSYYVAFSSRLEDGRPVYKYFPIHSLGDEEAFRLACECRTKMIEDLNSQGAGYTERHGK